jgi:hypothetical protein
MLTMALLMQGPTATTAAVPPKPVADKKICRRASETGSILPTRICHSAEEWKQLDKVNQDGALDTLRRRGTGMCNGPCR